MPPEHSAACLLVCAAGRDVLATRKDMAATRERLVAGGALVGSHHVDDYR